MPHLLLRIRLALQLERLLQHDHTVLLDGECRTGIRDGSNLCRPAVVWTATLFASDRTRVGGGSAEREAPVLNLRCRDARRTLGRDRTGVLPW